MNGTRPRLGAIFTEARAKAGKNLGEVVTDRFQHYADAFSGSFNASRTNKATAHTRENHGSKPQKYPPTTTWKA